MATTATIDLKNFTPNMVKNQPLWEDFLDAVSDELELVKVQIELKKRLFQTDQYTDINELIDLSKSLGYSPNLILKEDIDYIRQEVDSIVFKIKSKATYTFYNYLFKLVPKDGETYILFQDSLTLARAIDHTATFLNLSTHDIATPFTGLTSILHYNEYQDFSAALDADPLLYLDSDKVWYLDQDIVIKPTQHLAIEYQIGNLLQNGALEDVLITADYLAYLSAGVEYGRKVTNIPHIGINLSLPMGNQGFANQYSVAENIAQGTVAEQYTIPLLKTYASVTDNYRFIDNATPIEDPPLITILSSLFKYIVVGTGTKSFFNIDNQALMTDVDFHVSFEDINTTTFNDNYGNFEANMLGTFTIEDGVSGKTIGWNGTDTEALVAGMTLDDDDREWNFWITPGTQIVTDPSMAYINGYINVFYNTSNTSIDVTVTGGSGSATASYTMALATFEAGEFMLSVSFTQGATLKLFVDSVEQDSVDVSGIGTFTTTDDLYIGSADASNFFVGKIDEFRIYSKVLLAADRLELFSRKLGTLNYLSNEIYRKEISDNQLSTDGNYNVAVGTIPANTINDETVFVGDDVTITINETLEFPNLSPGYLEFSYYSFPNYYTAKANEKGQIWGDAATGTIDFETGIFELITFRVHSINKELIYTGSTSLISHSTDFTNIVPSSATLHYIVSGTSYSITDDGAGNFIHAPTITSGTIVYATGEVNVTFVNPTEVDPAEIYLVYDYKNESTPTLDFDVTVEYKLLNNLEITEVGILNDEGKVLLYANIPKAEYDSVINHTGFQFFVEQ